MKKSVTKLVPLKSYLFEWYLSLFLPLKEKSFFSATLKSLLHVFLISCYFSGIGLAQCPTLFTEDMKGIPGYPEINNLSVCGVADTLTYYILNTSGTTLLNSEFILHIPPGMQYGGFVNAFDPVYSVTEGDVSDVQNPSFTFQNIGADSVQIITIGITANCDVYDLSPTSEFIFDATFNFLYTGDPLSKPQSCTTNSSGEVDYSPYIKRPTINITAQTNPQIIITDDNQICNELTITQNGIDAVVTNFNFTVDSLDIENFSVSELSIDGAIIPYTYDTASQQLNVFIDAPFLPNGQLAEDEGINLTICYEAPLICDTDQKVFNLFYSATYGCSQDAPPCSEASTAYGSITYTPDFDAYVDVDVSTVQLPAICGDNAIFDVFVKGTNTDPILGLLEDLKIGFQICDSDAFDAVDARINGVSLPAGSYYYEDFYFVVDATTFTSDPDGPGVGFEDVDGDGIFDDLPGGNEVSMQIEAAIKCQNPNQINGCASIDCIFQQATVLGKHHCKKEFQELPEIIPAPFFSYGATSIEVNDTDISPAQDGSIVGFDFMQNSVDNNNVVSVNTVDIEFCYEFGTEGVGPCMNGETYFEVSIIGEKVVTTDLEIIKSSVSFQGNTLPAEDISTSYNIDSSELVIRILAGSNDPGLQCYNFTLALDECVCYAQQFLTTNLRVIEKCYDCTNGIDDDPCTIVRACQETTLATLRRCGCICPMSNEVVEMRRTDFGYTDKNRTTQLDKNSVDSIDLNRYLPCDSMYIHVEYEVLNASVISDNDFITFQILDQATTGTAFNPTREVIPDMHHAQIQEFSFEKVSAAGVRTAIDLSGIDCLTGQAALYRNLNDGYFDAAGFQPLFEINGQSTYNGRYDIYDNDRFYIELHDRNRQVARGANHGLSGDCWEYIRETLMGGLETGDKFHLIAVIPMQKNPYRELIPDVAALPAAVSKIIPRAFLYATIAEENRFVGSSCGIDYLYETHNPGPITASTTYNIEDCTATAEHIFTMVNTPNDWYVNEYRPDILEFDTILVPIPSPLIYGGNARVIFNNSTIPLADPAFDQNANCVVNNAGQTYCTSNSGATTYGSFNVNNLPTFGVGLPNEASAEMTLRYDLGRICPGVIPYPQDFALYYDYSGNCDYNPGGNYCNRTIQNVFGQNGFLNLDNAYLVEDCSGINIPADELLFDQRDYHITEDTSYALLMNDNSNPLPPLTSSILSTLLVDSTGASEFNTYEVCAELGLGEHMNIITTITLAPTVELLNITSSTAGLSYRQVRLDTSGSTYLVQIPSLAGGECVEFEIETELIICPYPGVGTEICIKTTSSCSNLDADIAAQLFADGGEACTATESCYEYTAGISEIQAEWESTTREVPLCSTNEFIVVVKNTRIATLKDIEFNFNLPTGLNWIPGSFEYEYPQSSGNWKNISDPIANGANAFGPLWTMTDDDMIDDINQDGFPGILHPTLNANRLRIRFDAKTVCDAYVSNTPLYFEATAADPCESRISSGYTKNEGVLIDNAIPIDNAQFLLTANPIKYTCGEAVPVSIAGVNLSITGGETYKAEACFIFPPQLEYLSGSIELTLPATWTPTYVNETLLSNGYMQVCFDLPDGIKPFETFAFNAAIFPDSSSMCETLLFGGQVKSLLEDQVCIGDDNTLGTGDDTTCDVYINNTINDQIPIRIAPPAEIRDVELILECDNDPDSTTYTYNLELFGVSTTDYNGPVKVEWFRDLNQNGLLDPTDILLATDDIIVNVFSDESSINSSTITLPEVFSCPLLVQVTLETECNCAMDSYYVDKPPTPAFVAQFDGPALLCEGDNFAIGICPGFDFELSGNASMTVTEDSLFVALATGENAIVNVTAQHASCLEGNFQIEINAIGALEINPYATVEVCDMECTTLALDFPEEWMGNMNITWSPTTYLDDPNSFTPMICNPAADITYTVTVNNPNSGCVAETSFPVQVINAMAPTINYLGYDNCFLPYDPTKLVVAPAGLRDYKFYYIDELNGGPDVLLQSGPNHQFSLPFAEGKFYVIAEDPSRCIVTTDTILLEVPTCIFDLALTKTLSPTQPLPIRVGDKVTFDITIYNQGTLSADSITITDFIPAGYALMDTNWTDIGAGNASYLYLGPLTAGDSVTIPIMVEVQAGINISNSINRAEITSASNENDEVYPDEDSTENNDDIEKADEDDEDPATIPIFDLALIKTLATDGPYTNGDTLAFDIKVYNQGNVTASNVEVTDYIACGYIFDPTINPDWIVIGNDVKTTLPNAIAPNDSTSISINLILQNCSLANGYKNIAEISSSEDALGNDTSNSDIDSDADDIVNNDGAMRNNAIAGENGDEDDSDFATPKIFNFDLALTKTTLETGPFRYGDTITFDFNISNQGTIPATNIEITEFLPCGYSFDANINPDWALVGAYPTTTLTDTLAIQESITISIDLIIQSCEAAGAWINTAEISAATDTDGIPRDDIDSEPDNDPNNDGLMSDNENSNDNGDEDDSDLEAIAIFDLAQIKEIITPGPYAWGDTIEYSITVVNQGNITASNITITDYIPAGLAYDASLNTAWTGTSSTVETSIAGPLAPGDTARTNIYLVLTQATGLADDFTNISEISSAEDMNGNTPIDADSNADSNVSNDEGGIPNSSSDNQFDGNGTDDEDDQDPAILDIFDLALNKTTTWTTPITYGDIIPFQINVSNQGTITATNIEVTEYIPCGYIYQTTNNSLWVYDASSSTATTTINGPLAPGETLTVDIYLTVQACANNPSTNWENAAEISSAADEAGNDISTADIDSTPDDIPNNDGTVIDNNTSSTNGDEDDHDIETPLIFDLALTKVIADGQVTPVTFGADVTMTISVYNQGTIPATNVRIADYLPAGFTLSANDTNAWTDANSDGIYEHTITGPIAVDANASVDIVLTVQTAASNDDYINVAEISSAEDDMGNDMTNRDIDSTTDDNPTNDSGGVVNSNDDNAIDGNGENGADEDDSDPAFVPVTYTDLALIKKLGPTQAQAVMPGEFVDFEITIYNQGTIDAYNVSLIDYVPAGLIYDTAFGINAIIGWSDTDADGIPNITIDGPIPAFTGEETIRITLQVDSTVTVPADLTNIAEITGSEDEFGTPQTDIDSTPDDEPNNDPTTDNVTANTAGDEDDNDIASINIFQNIFDLALKKIVSPEFIGGAQVGDDIPFDIWVYNQGNIPATNITITDYLPAGTSLSPVDFNNWTDNNNDGIYETFIPFPLAPGDSMLVEIILTVDVTPTLTTFINEAEISSADDLNGNPVMDIDSTPDGDNTNDMGGDPYGMSNNQTEDDGTTDEDDHDPEPFPIFDLAIKKTTTDVGPFTYDDVITFDYTVYNQGNIPSANIALIDYTPCGFLFDASLNPDWSLSGANATTVIPTIIVPGDSIVVSINYLVEACHNDTNSAWRNIGEITASEDDQGNDMSQEDVDSQPDTDPTNDGTMSDNDTDNTNGDEDDSDFELVQIFDLALKKEISKPRDYVYGDVVTYAITVYNQGNTPATNIEITDYVPTSLIYDPALNPTWSGTAPNVSTIISDTLWGLGASSTVYIDLILAPNYDDLAGYNNIAEIKSSEDVQGNDTSHADADSTPNDDPTDDKGGLVGEDSDDQIYSSRDEDEDDHDPALVQIFDLALSKTSNTPGPYTYGDVVTYDITIYNQGSFVADNIVISDYLPCGLTFLPGSNSLWNYNATTGVATTTINSLLVGGDSITVQLLLEVQACNDSNAWRNIAEISSATDGIGNLLTDIDSTPDNVPTNDGDMQDNVIDGTNGDQDDSDFHDIAIFDLAFIKQLAPMQASPVLQGNSVAYQMTIFNQGNVDAFDIAIVDYIPKGLIFNLAANSAASANNANDWSLVNGVPTYIINTLAPSDFVVININFTVDFNFREIGITNFGEIAYAANTPGGANTADADSNADGNIENDIHLIDNAVDGQSGDEDDHDPAFIQLFAFDDITIIGDTSIATVDPVAIDTISDVDPEATPSFIEPVIEEVDCSKYPAYCYHGLAIELMPMRMVEIWASDISVNDYSPCPDYKLSLWHKSMPMKQPTTLAEVKALPSNLVFTCQTLGNQEIQLYITDPEGNWNFCETYIHVQDNNIACIETQTTDATNALLGGQVNTWKGDAVEEVLLSTTQADYMTEQDGFYHFELPMEKAYTVTPQKNHIPLNGVSTFDLVLMTKHILGVQPFDNPYQWIAADVNQSKTVTAFDLVQLRKLILAIDTELPNNTSWRFVDADYKFSSDSPLTEDFPEQVHINKLSSNMLMNFVAIKIGDINGNVRANAFQQAAPRNSNKVFEVAVADQFLKAGQTYQIDLQAKDISNIQGYQFTVTTKNVMINQIHGALMTTENFGLNNLDAGRLTVSWNQLPNYLVSEEKLFTIQLQATKDTRLSEVLQLNNQPTIAEAYDLEGNIMDVQLKFSDAAHANEFDLAQNQPNPFKNQTNVTYTLPSNSQVELILRDEAGRVIKVVKQDGKAGYNLIPLHDLDIAPGFIYYQLITKFGTKSKKMIRVE